MKFSLSLESYRVQLAGWPKTPVGSRHGWFVIPFRSYVLRAMADDGEETGWEHVSVSHESAKRSPNWEEMCFVKSLFWDDDETVLQFHPKKSDYVNLHNHCLHLWKPRGKDVELPPRILV